MKISANMPRLKGYRFPREIVAYAVWAYHRFILSAADEEYLLTGRGRQPGDRAEMGELVWPAFLRLYQTRLTVYGRQMAP